MSPYTTYAAAAAVTMSAIEAPGTTQSEKNASSARNNGSMCMANPTTPTPTG